MHGNVISLRKYTVTVVAVSCDADIGDSRPSSPLYIDGATLCRPKVVAFASDENGTLQKPKLDTSPFLEVHAVAVGKDFIDLDWKNFLGTNVTEDYFLSNLNCSFSDS